MPVEVDVMRLILLYAVCDISHSMHNIYKNNDIINFKWYVYSTCNPVTSTVDYEFIKNDILQQPIFIYIYVIHKLLPIILYRFVSELPWIISM